MAELRIASDGLPARVIKAHTLEKFDRHASTAPPSNTGMQYHWKDNRGYLELFAGPGLIDPEDINNEWKALEFLAARRYPRLEFLINLPINAIERAIGRRILLAASTALEFGHRTSGTYAGATPDAVTVVSADIRSYCIEYAGYFLAGRAESRPRAPVLASARLETRETARGSRGRRHRLPAVSPAQSSP